MHGKHQRTDNDHTSAPCKSKRRLSRHGSHGAARLLLVDGKKSCVLLLREQRDGGACLLTMLGGKRNSAETFEKCASREALEETGRHMSKKTAEEVAKGNFHLQGYCENSKTYIFVYWTTEQEDLALSDLTRSKLSNSHDSRQSIALEWIPWYQFRKEAWRKENMHIFSQIEVNSGLGSLVHKQDLPSDPSIVEPRRETLSLLQNTSDGGGACHAARRAPSSNSIVSLETRSTDSYDSAQPSSCPNSCSSGHSSNWNTSRVDVKTPPLLFKLAQTLSAKSSVTPPLTSSKHSTASEGFVNCNPIEELIEVAPLMPIKSSFVEIYDGERLTNALAILEKTSPMRAIQIKRLEGMVSGQEAPKDAKTRRRQTSLLHRLRRVSDAHKFMVALDMHAFTPRDTPNIRCLNVEYHRKRLSADLDFKEYGRRYARCRHKGATEQRVTVEKTVNLSVGSVVAPHDKQFMRRDLAHQGAPREVRAFLCENYYIDVDMVNCFPEMALCLGKMHGLDKSKVPNLVQYVSSDENREQILKEIMQVHGLSSREDAKQLPLAMLHGGSYQGWMREVAAPIQNERSKFMVQFQRNVTTLARTILDAKTPIESQIVADRKHFMKNYNKKDMPINSGLSEVERSMFAYILQTYEDRVLCMIVNSLQAGGWEIGSLQYDGLYVRKQNVKGEAHEQMAERLEQDLRAAESFVRNNTKNHLSIRLKQKPMSNKTEVLAEWKNAHRESCQ